MKTTNIKTDNLSFGLYLSKIDHNTLVEHARENMFPGAIIDVILENEHLLDDCITILFKKEISLPIKLKRSMLSEELALTDADTIIEYMILLFSKKNIINMILEYTDEDARLDIIANQESWKKQNILPTNYN